MPELAAPAAPHGAPTSSPPADPAGAAPSSPVLPGGVVTVAEADGTAGTVDELPPPPIYTATLGDQADLGDEFSEAELPPEVEAVVQEVAASQQPEVEPRPPDPNGAVAGLLCMVNIAAIDYIGRNILKRVPPPPTAEDVAEGKLAWAPYAAKIEASLGLDSDSARLWMWQAKYGLPRTIFAPRAEDEAPDEAAPAAP